MPLKKIMSLQGLFFLVQVSLFAVQAEQLEEVPDTIGEIKIESTQKQADNGKKTNGKMFDEKLFSYRGYVQGILNYADHYEHQKTTDSQLSTFEANLQLDYKPNYYLLFHLDFGGKSFNSKGDMYQNMQEDIAMTNEGYFSLQIKNWNLSLGKKRVMIGSGMMVNPLDLMNPQKNMPGQPEQREGCYLTSLNFTELFFNNAFSQVYLDFVFLPGLRKDLNTGLIQDFNNEHSYLARLGGVLFKNELAFYYMNKWDQSFWGFTFSRYVTKDLELHLETLLFQQRKPILTGLYQNTDQKLYQNSLIGLRYTVMNKCVWGLEYYYQSDALSEDEWRTAFNMPLRPYSLNKLEANSTLYEKNTSFTLRRHYILSNLSYQDLLSDLNLSLNLFFSPEDSATMIFPKLNYMASSKTIIGLGAIFLLGKKGTHQQYKDMPFEYLFVFDMTFNF